MNRMSFLFFVCTNFSTEWFVICFSSSSLLFEFLEGVGDFILKGTARSRSEKELGIDPLLAFFSFHTHSRTYADCSKLFLLLVWTNCLLTRQSILPRVSHIIYPHPHSILFSTTSLSDVYGRHATFSSYKRSKEERTDCRTERSHKVNASSYDGPVAATFRLPAVEQNRTSVCVGVFSPSQIMIQEGKWSSLSYLREATGILLSLFLLLCLFYLLSVCRQKADKSQRIFNSIVWQKWVVGKGIPSLSLFPFEWNVLFVFSRWSFFVTWRDRREWFLLPSIRRYSFAEEAFCDLFVLSFGTSDVATSQSWDFDHWTQWGNASCSFWWRWRGEKVHV